jgi:hypothetical protein
MFIVSEDERAAIQATYQERGELAAVMEMRRHFPGIRDNAIAQHWTRVIARWHPSPSKTGCGKDESEA